MVPHCAHTCCSTRVLHQCRWLNFYLPCSWFVTFSFALNLLSVCRRTQREMLPRNRSDPREQQLNKKYEKCQSRPSSTGTVSMTSFTGSLSSRFAGGITVSDHILSQHTEKWKMVGTTGVPSGPKTTPIPDSTLRMLRGYWNFQER